MFDLFRSQRSAVKYFLTFLLSMVALSMVITLIPGLFSTPTADLNDPVLVEVGDEAVTIGEVQMTLQEFSLTGQAQPDNMGVIAQQIIDTQVGNKVLMQEAASLGIKPTPKELADWIREQMPFLWQGGQFDGQQYAAMVQQRFRTSVPSFEARLLQDLTIENRLKPLVTDSIVLTEEEVKAIYRRENESARILYAVVDSESYRSQVQVTDEKLNEFLAANMVRYRVPEMRSLKIVTMRPEAPPEIQVSEAEVQNFYQQNMYRFESQDRVLASHILFMTIDPNSGEPLPADQIAAKETLANEVLEKVKAGGDFAELATQYSEDPGNKDAGGDLGWVTSGQMVPTFEQATFALEEGAISDVVKTEFGFHIIKSRRRDSAVRRPLEEVRDEIVADIRAERAEEAQYDRADQVARALQDAPPDRIDEIAAQFGLDVRTAENLRQFEFAGVIPGANADVVRQLSTAQVGSVVTHVTEDATIFASVTAVSPPRDAALAEVRDRVQADFVRSEMSELARARAQEVFDAASEAGGLREAARRLGLEVKESAPFKRTDMIDGFASATSIAAKVFNGAPGTLGGPVSAGAGMGVFEVSQRLEADMTEFFDQRDAIRSKALQARQTQMFEIFKDDALKRYRDSGKIKRYETRITQFVQAISRS